MRKNSGVVTVILVCLLVIFRHAIALEWRADPTAGGDLLVSVGIGLLTAILAVLAGHVATEKLYYRWSFYIFGSILAALFVVSGFRTYFAARGAVTPETITIEAVHEANKHTDQAVDKLYSQLSALLPPPPPSTKVKGPEQVDVIKVTDAKGATATKSIVIVDTSCSAADSLNDQSNPIAMSSDQIGRGLGYGMRYVLAKVNRPLFRFRIRSGAPISELDFNGDTNLEVLQRYQGLSVIDVRVRIPTEGPFTINLLSSEDLVATCFERIN